MQQQKSSEERLDELSYPDYRSVAGWYLYMSEMRYDTTFETQELMRDASILTVTSLKLTKRIARYLRRQQQQVLVDGDWPRCARTTCSTPGWGINDWKIPGARFEWDGTYNIIQFSRGRGESNNERNVDLQLKYKIGRTQCRRTLETPWAWGTRVDETNTTSRPWQVEQFS